MPERIRETVKGDKFFLSLKVLENDHLPQPLRVGDLLCYCPGVDLAGFWEGGQRRAQICQ